MRLSHGIGGEMNTDKLRELRLKVSITRYRANAVEAYELLTELLNILIDAGEAEPVADKEGK